MCSAPISLLCIDTCAVICQYLTTTEIITFNSVCPAHLVDYIEQIPHAWTYSNITESELYKLTTFGTKKIRSLIRNIVPHILRNVHTDPPYPYPTTHWLWVFDQYTSLERIDVPIVFNPVKDPWWHAMTSPCRPQFPKLRALNLRFITPTTQEGLLLNSQSRWSTLLTAFPSLRELHVPQLRMCPELLETVSSCLTQLQVLQVDSFQFSTTRVDVSDSGCSLSSPMFPKLRSLQVDELIQQNTSTFMKRHMPHVVDFHLNRWHSLVWTLNDLQSLHFHSTIQSRQDQLFDMTGVPHDVHLFPLLRVLCITSSASHIAVILGQTPLLEVLDLNVLSYSSTSSVELPKAICSLSRLKSLSVQSFQKNQHGLERMNYSVDILSDLCHMLGHPHKQRMWVEERERHRQEYEQWMTFGTAISMETICSPVLNTTSDGVPVTPFRLEHLRVPMHENTIEFLQTTVCKDSLLCLEVQLLELNNCCTPFESVPDSTYMSYSEILNTSSYETTERMSEIPRLIVRQAKGNASLTEIGTLIDVVSSFGQIELYGMHIGAPVDQLVTHADDGDQVSSILERCNISKSNIISNLNAHTPSYPLYEWRDRIWSAYMNQGVWDEEWRSRDTEPYRWFLPHGMPRPQLVQQHMVPNDLYVRLQHPN